VAATHLQFTVHVFVEIIKIVSLYKLVSKFGKRHALTISTSINTVFNRIFALHIIDRDVFAYIANKIEELKIFEPIVIVNQYSRSFATVKIKKFFKLLFLAFLVVHELVYVQ